MRAISACGYVTPTPIQTKALPPQFEQRDLLALAETGSGKTAAFVLPMLQSLAQHPVNPAPREAVSLILAPTRELALQIDAEVAKLARYMNIRHAVLLGGVGKGPQIHALRRGVHVLVATPGRLLDLIAERHCDLKHVRTLVLDEADRMFDMGFIRDIRKIAAMVPKERRTALFSATMPDEIRKLAHELLTEPMRVDLSPKQIVVDRIDQKVMIVRAPEKQSRLHTILKDEACSRVIVFTRTKRGADRVADRLGMAGFGAAAIHGNKAQNARQRALKDFSAGHVRILVATDIAARGIDVSDISHVINFDMPVEPETYVHRIGRTARKGTSGCAISLCDPAEKDEIRAIERLMKQPIEVIDDVGGEPLPAAQHTRRDEGRGQRRERSEGGPRHRSGGPRDRHNGERREHRHDGEGREHRDARPARNAHADTARNAHADTARDAHADPARHTHSERPAREGRRHHEHARNAHPGEKAHDAAHADRRSRNPERHGGEVRHDSKPHHFPNGGPNGSKGQHGASHRPHREPGTAQHRAHKDEGSQHKPQQKTASHAGDRPHDGNKRGWGDQHQPKFLRKGSGRHAARRPGSNSAA